eukprot:6206210-Pleurochrysis_carterae.AAC.2
MIMSSYMNASKHRHYLVTISILTTQLVGTPILDGATSGVTIDLRFSRPYWASTTGLLEAALNPDRSPLILFTDSNFKCKR